MDDLVLVQKISRAEMMKNSRMGRPIRENFALRNYPKACILAIPPSLVADGDRVDFFLSKVGFAIQITPNGSRTISGRKSGRSASVPLEVRIAMDGAKIGTHELIGEDRLEGLYFFPFSQLPKA